MNLVITAFCTTTLLLLSSIASAQESDLGFEKIKRWEGLTVDTTIVKEGDQSGRWEDTVNVDRIYSKRGFPEDMSDYEGFKIWIHSEAVTEASIAIAFYSDNDATEGSDYYVHPVPIDWTGWKQIEVSFDDLKEIREPLGFSNIREVRFASEGYTIGEPDPNTRLNLDGIEFYGGKMTPTPSERLAAETNLKWESTLTDAIGDAKQNDKMIFISACGTSGSDFNEVVELCNSQMVNEELNNFSLFSFDPDNDKNSSTFFKIQTKPTFLVFNPSGEELFSMSVIPESDDFAGFLNTVRN